MTQLQMREIQTRAFFSREAKEVLKEMMNVLQDDQFIFKNANVSQFGEDFKVRVNFQRKVLDNRGGVIKTQVTRTL